MPQTKGFFDGESVDDRTKGCEACSMLRGQVLTIAAQGSMHGMLSFQVTLMG